MLLSLHGTGAANVNVRIQTTGLGDFVSETSESIYAYIVVIASRRRRPVSALHFISIAAKEEKLAFAGGKIPKIVKLLR